MQARGFLVAKYCWPKVIYCICQSNKLEWKIKKKLGGQTRGQPKIWGGMARPAPRRIATACIDWLLDDDKPFRFSRSWTRYAKFLFYDIDLL